MTGGQASMLGGCLIGTGLCTILGMSPGPGILIAGLMIFGSVIANLFKDRR